MLVAAEARGAEDQAQEEEEDTAKPRGRQPARDALVPLADTRNGTLLLG